MAGAALWVYLRRTGAPRALATLLFVTGTLHFVAPAGFESIVPGFLGWPAFWVAASGVAELGCAGLLWFRATRRFAGWACVLLFIAVYPANVKMALDSLHGNGNATLAWLRLPLQIPLILWALTVARRAAPDATGQDRYSGLVKPKRAPASHSRRWLP